MASVTFNTDTIKKLQSFVETHQDSITEHEYIQFCNLLMATYKHPPLNATTSHTPPRVQHEQHIAHDESSLFRNIENSGFRLLHSFIRRVSCVDLTRDDFYDIHKFSTERVTIYRNAIRNTSTRVTTDLPEHFQYVKKHRFSKTHLLELIRSEFSDNRPRFKNLSKDALVSHIVATRTERRNNQLN